MMNKATHTKSRLLKIGIFVFISGLLIPLLADKLEAVSLKGDFNFQQFDNQVQLAKLHVSERNANAPKISLQAENILLIDLLHQIAEELKVNISINSGQIRNKKVTYHASNKYVYDVLEDLLYNTNLGVTISENQKTLIVFEKEQSSSASDDLLQSTVSGTVTSSADGETLPAVNIQIEGTTRGTVTDINGEYSIELESGDRVLIFSSLGFRTVRIEVGDREIVNVALNPDLLQIDEVVVTALSLASERRSLGYSLQSVDSDEIIRAREQSISNSIAGRFAGVQVNSQAGVPGGAASVNIRGRSSLLGNNEPLYVVDGVPISNTYSTTVVFSSVDNSNRAIDINPEDVESVTVLKGPAASALYGIQAANGVILITTKRGPSGDEGRTTINISSSVTVNQVGQLYDLQSSYGPGRGGNLSLGSPDSWGPALTDLRYDGNTNSPYNPQGTPVLATDPSATNVPVNPFDNFDAFFTDGIGTNNSVSISTGTRDRSLYVSMSRNNEDGFIPLTFFNRTSFRITGDSRVSERFKISGTANYINSQGRRAGRGSNFAGVMIPLTRTPVTFDITNGTGDPTSQEAIQLPDGTQRNFRLGAGGPDGPGWIVVNAPYRDEVNRVLGNVQADFEVLPWLGLMYRLGADVYADRRRHNFELGSLSGDGIRGRLFEENLIERSINSDLIVTAEQTLTDDLSMRVVAGQNYYSNQFQRLYVSGRGFVQPGLFNFNNITEDPDISNSTIEYRRAALFGNINLNYRDMVYLDVTGRNEWSSTLPSSNNSFFYPAASVSFIFSELMDVADNPYFNYGQIRFSYASVGNDTDPYRTNTFFVNAGATDGYGIGISMPFQGNPGFRSSTTLGNAQIKPERNTTFEIGGEFQFLENLISLDVTYYNSNNKDQIIPVSIPGSSGFTNVVLNAGELENKGWEVLLTTRQVRGTRFSWDTTFNYSRNRNTVVSLFDNLDFINLGGVGGRIVPRLEPGKPYGVFYAQGWVRDDNGNVVIRSSNPTDPLYGYPQVTSDLIELGDPNPDWTLGVTNNIRFRNFFSSFLIDIRKGGDVWNGVEALLRFRGQGSSTENRGEPMVFDGVKEDGSPNDIVVNPGENWYGTSGGDNYFGSNENFIEDASWVRLRELTLGYSVPRNVTDPLGISNIEVSVWGRNLLLFTGYSGIDPDTNLYGPNQSLGIDYYNNPGGRSFGVTLNLTL